jgi:hypothetical protein
MTAIETSHENRIRGRTRPDTRWSPNRQRVLFGILALTHAIVCRLIEQKVLVDSGLFESAGLHWFQAGIIPQIGFLVLAAAPALTFLPVRMTRSSDPLLIIFYGTVFVPATALFPNTTSIGLGTALMLTLVSMAGLYLANSLSRVSLGQAGLGVKIGLSQSGYDLMLYAAAILVMLSYRIFVPTQVLELDAARLYEYRAAFTDQATKLPPVLLYVFVNSALALSPMMIVRGIIKRKWVMVGLAFAVAYYTFLVTSYRALIFVAFFVAVLTYVLRLRVPAGISIFAAFLGIAGTVVLLDTLSGARIPVQTFTFHYRLFGNAATVTNAYLELFSSHQKFYFSQSFLHFLITPPTDTPYPLLVGAVISDVVGNWANGNMVADAFANLGYPGVLLAYMALGMILALYNYIALAKDRMVAALTLAAPGFYLNNGGLQSAVLSGGLGVMMLLVIAYPPASGERLQGNRPRKPLPKPRLGLAREGDARPRPQP